MGKRVLVVTSVYITISSGLSSEQVPTHMRAKEAGLKVSANVIFPWTSLLTRVDTGRCPGVLLQAVTTELQTAGLEHSRWLPPSCRSA